MLRLSSVIQISSFLHFKEAIIIVKQNIYVQSKFVCMNIEQHRTNTKAQVDRGIGYDEANDFFRERASVSGYILFGEMNFNYQKHAFIVVTEAKT